MVGTADLTDKKNYDLDCRRHPEPCACVRKVRVNRARRDFEFLRDDVTLFPGRYSFDYLFFPWCQVHDFSPLV